MENESGKKFKSRLCEGCTQTIESKGLYTFAIDDQNFKTSLYNDVGAENVNPNCNSGYVPYSNYTKVELKSPKPLKSANTTTFLKSPKPNSTSKKAGLSHQSLPGGIYPTMFDAKKSTLLNDSAATIVSDMTGDTTLKSVTLNESTAFDMSVSFVNSLDNTPASITSDGSMNSVGTEKSYGRFVDGLKDNLQCIQEGDNEMSFEKSFSEKLAEVSTDAVNYKTDDECDETNRQEGDTTVMSAHPSSKNNMGDLTLNTNYDYEQYSGDVTTKSDSTGAPTVLTKGTNGASMEFSVSFNNGNGFKEQESAVDFGNATDLSCQTSVPLTVQYNDGDETLLSTQFDGSAIPAKDVTVVDDLGEDASGTQNDSPKKVIDADITCVSVASMLEQKKEIDKSVAKLKIRNVVEKTRAKKFMTVFHSLLNDKSIHETIEADQSDLPSPEHFISENSRPLFGVKGCGGEYDTLASAVDAVERQSDSKSVCSDSSDDTLAMFAKADASITLSPLATVETSLCKTILEQSSEKATNTSEQGQDIHGQSVIFMRKIQVVLITLALFLCTYAALHTALPTNTVQVAPSALEVAVVPTTTIVEVSALNAVVESSKDPVEIVIENTYGEYAALSINTKSTGIKARIKSVAVQILSVLHAEFKSVVQEAQESHFHEHFI